MIHIHITKFSYTCVCGCCVSICTVEEYAHASFVRGDLYNFALQSQVNTEVLQVFAIEWSGARGWYYQDQQLVLEWLE